MRDANHGKPVFEYLIERLSTLFHPNVLFQSVMHNLSYLTRVSLGGSSVLPFTRGVRVGTIARLMKEGRKTGVQTRDPPRLADGHTLAFPVKGNKTVHTSVKDTVNEAMLGKELTYTLLLPIPVVTRPFNEDGSTQRDGMLGDFNECSPQFAKQLVMALYLLNSLDAMQKDIEVL